MPLCHPRNLSIVCRMPPSLDTPRLRALITAELPSLAALRHDLHAHPELGYHEHRTSAVVQRELAAIGVKHVAGLAGGTGVVGLIEATDSAARQHPAIGLRADMDCLPITEQTGVHYASTTPGLMHACGHDGHTAMLIGAARVLAKLSHRPRNVLLFFQPAEEGGGGADRFCKEGALDGKVIGPRVEKMFGLHGWPDLPLGVVATRPGPLLASTDEIRVAIRGTQAHGAYPHYSKDTIVCAAHVIVALQTVVSRNIGPLDSVVVTIGKVEGGTATNIIPERTSFIGTIRALTPQTRALARTRVREVCEGIATALGCRAEVELNEGYPVTHNDGPLTEEFFRIARSALGPERVQTMLCPTMGGEDFSYYGQHAAAVFFCLGLRKPGPAGETFATLHQPDFDFNDEAMPTGIEIFCRLATA